MKQYIHYCYYTAKFPLAYDVGFAYPSGQQYMNGREISFRDVLGGQTIKVYFYMRYMHKIHVLYCKLTV